MADGIMGRPPHEPTEESRAMVSRMSAYGINQEVIAQCLKINTDTLSKYYRHEIDTGLALCTDKIANHLVNRATVEDDVTAQIFYLKTRAGWSDKTKEALEVAKTLAEQFAAFNAANAQKK